MNDHRLGTRNPYAGSGSTRSPKYSQEIQSQQRLDRLRAANVERTRVTRNHDIIRQWAERRGARPATMPGSEYDGQLRVLRFDFPGYGGAVLRPVDWDDWFAAFDAKHMHFRYQDRRADGTPSNFNRLERPTREDR
ncbi:hypothetical protein ACIBCN_07240 [Nocardia sp. NPDC051052]|uniref:hypothetical protein n=1 Tax=Nocardia sp. NPDC051052 TaxID=3364322 RepID=UPI0037B82452